MRSSIREFATFDWHRFRQARLPLVGAAVIVVFVLLAVLAPFIVSDPTQIEMRREQDGETLTPPFPPNPRNLFGTDQLGRDIFARVVFGSAYFADCRPSGARNIDGCRHTARAGLRLFPEDG